MKKLFAIADRYLQESDWKTIALLKFCLLALGIVVGALLPARHKKTAVAVGLPLFFVTYLPLMAKLIHVAAEQGAQAPAPACAGMTDDGEDIGGVEAAFI